MRRRGSIMIAALWFGLLLFTIMVAIMSASTQIRARATNDERVHQAYWMAVSGADYAQAMIEQGRWRSHRRFRSPLLSGGSFVVSVTRRAGTWTIRSQGLCAGHRQQVVRRVR